MRPVIANLGFVSQAAGLLMILPIISAFYYDYAEVRPLISFFIASFSFFAAGFLFNALSIRAEMSLKHSCQLIALAFFLLALIGSIPYLYIGVFRHENPLTQLSHCFFESMSGYTSTGLTVITNISDLPKSLILYRGLSQWIGGIGIVFLLLAFFFPSESMSITSLGRTIGLDLTKARSLAKINEELKRVMLHVILIYFVYMLVFGAATYLLLAFFTPILSRADIVTPTSLMFAAFATGGFSPVTDFLGIVNKPIIFLLIAAMMIGGVNFIIHDRIFSGRFKEALTREFILYIILILIFGFLISYVAKLDYTTSFFNVVSASTTTGYCTLDMEKLGESTKLLFTTIMLIGGMSLSTTAGIKILRLMFIFKAIPWTIRRLAFGLTEPLKLEGKELGEPEVFVHLLLPLISIALILVSAFVFTLYKFDLVNSLFEVTSAYSGTGLSVGIVKADLALGLKWLLVPLMLIGRIEVVVFLVALTRAPKAQK